ncbi:DJ-1/PfpI family protein [bacterium]|nr:DJ-1/PfpI family protein [bacterium]
MSQQNIFFKRAVAVVFILLATFLFIACTTSDDDDNDDNDTPPPGPSENVGIKALMLIPKNYGANYYLIRDNFDRYGWSVTLASINHTVNPCPVYAGPLGCPTLTMDILIEQIDEAFLDSIDVVCIMFASHWAGDPFADFIASTATLELIRSANSKGKVIVAWCSGVRVLAAAQILQGIEITGYPAYQDEYEAAGAIFLGGNLPYVVDGTIITARNGQSHNVEVSEVIARVIEGNQNSSCCGGIAIGYDDKSSSSALTVTDLSYFGTSDSEGACAISLTNDGGVVLAGYAWSSDSGDLDGLVLKLDHEGNEQWQTRVGGQYWDRLYDVIQSSDGCSIVAGSSSEGGAGFRNGLVCKIDANGNPAWSSTFGGPLDEQALSICQSAQGTYVVTGYTTEGAGEYDICLAAFDNDGRQLWYKTYGGTAFERGNAVKPTNDGGFIVVGNTDSFSAGLRDVYVIKTDAEGNELWSQCYGTASDYETGNDILPLAQGGYIIVGDRDGLYTELMNMYIIRIDENGEIIWSRSPGEGTFYDYGTGICAGTNDHIQIVGIRKSNISTTNDVALLSINLDGDILFKDFFGGSGSEWAGSLTLNHDLTRILITGQSNSGGNGAYDAWFVSTDAQI